MKPNGRIVLYISFDPLIYVLRILAKFVCASVQLSDQTISSGCTAVYYETKSHCDCKNMITTFMLFLSPLTGKDCESRQVFCWLSTV